jgi:hypothetical protein
LTSSVNELVAVVGMPVSIVGTLTLLTMLLRRFGKTRFAHAVDEVAAEEVWYRYRRRRGITDSEQRKSLMPQNRADEELPPATEDDDHKRDGDSSGRCLLRDGAGLVGERRSSAEGRRVK